ncbi:hypothetical protein WNY61_19270 [Sulfitobacter sp. AS92]
MSDLLHPLPDQIGYCIAERANILLNGLAEQDPDAIKWARVRSDAVP